MTMPAISAISNLTAKGERLCLFFGGIAGDGEDPESERL